MLPSATAESPFFKASLSGCAAICSANATSDANSAGGAEGVEDEGAAS